MLVQLIRQHCYCRIINIKLGKSKKQNSIHHIEYYNNRKITDATEIASPMNSYFCKIGEKLSKDAQTVNAKGMILPQTNMNAIYLNPTDPLEIHIIINNFDHKSGGIDNINTNILKTISEFIIKHLAYFQFVYWKIYLSRLTKKS